MPWACHDFAVNLETTLDLSHRLVITSAMRKAAGLKPGQKLTVQASPGLLIISTPHVPARLVKRGRLKLIDAPKPEFTVEEAVNKARHYTR